MKSAFPPRWRIFGVEGKYRTVILLLSSRTSPKSSAPIVSHDIVIEEG
jgi:hypothetical protein